MRKPETLNEAILALEALLGEEDKAFLDKATDPHAAAIELHHSLGRHLRNEWGLWHGSPLANHLREDHSVEHPDDMSHFILVEFCRRTVTSVWDRLGKDED